MLIMDGCLFVTSALGPYCGLALLRIEEWD